MNVAVERLIKRHNELARAAKIQKLDRWDGTSDDLRARVVGLRTKTHPGSLGAAAAKLLCKIDYVEKRSVPIGPTNKYKAAASSAEFRTVGLPYAEIEMRLRERFPESQVTNGALRWYATKIADLRYARFRNYTLPERRPRSR